MCLPGCLTAPLWRNTVVAVATAAVAEVDPGYQAEWLNAAVIAATCNATVASPGRAAGGIKVKTLRQQ